MFFFSVRLNYLDPRFTKRMLVIPQRCQLNDKSLTINYSHTMEASSVASSVRE